MVKVRPFLFACALALAPLTGFSPVTFAESAQQPSQTTEVMRAGPVNINAASVQELAAKLHGVGASKAQAIVEHREANGAFTSVEQLSEVKGIGQATVDRNRDIIRIE